VLLEGPVSYLTFFSYSNLNLSVVVYCGIALYLLYVFRREGFLKTVFAVTLAILVVGELWELPLNWVRRGDMHPFIFAVGYLQRYVPLFFWFWMFRKVYLKFLRRQWFVALPFLGLVVLLTSESLVLLPQGVVSVALSFLLHLSYAFLLVFLPFQFYFKKVKT